MDKQKKNFADDLDSNKNNEKEQGDNLHGTDTPHDKWNDIQDEYLKKYPEVNLEDLYFEAGGFERILEKIAEVRKLPIAEVRKEIEQW